MMLTAFDQSKAEHSRQDYEVRRQDDIKEENNKYIYSQEVGHLKSSTVAEKEGDDASELTRRQVLNNIKVNSANKRQLSPSTKEELYSKGIDSRLEKQSKSESEEDTENKHFRHNNFASVAVNLAFPANEQVKDEPLYISLYRSTSDAQTLHQKDTNHIYNQKQNFAYPKHRPSNGKVTYNKEQMEEGLRVHNRFSRRIHNKMKMK
ncbi:uncharacterized protein LOC111874419 isoform X2 [Cryptotermes secundus]|uniref:uncharacterized protein LOC111874419 isoform X2 n=1 Tax=Cryptotermes secundus TaxID=105785 RepID=UPI000CD7DDF6|nr:uncharacterized protein LOC111874419 isoform X2 [Cryptotermes secundus]